MNIEELEKRVTQLENIEKIKALHREYLFFVSNLEIDKALNCFTEDITVITPIYGNNQGKEAVSRLFKNSIYQNVLQSKDGHFTGQSVVSVEGDKAKGHWMFYRFLSDSSSKRWVQGRYDCEYVKERGEWKFSLLKLTSPWPEFFK